MANVVYVLTNEAMPGIVKIGLTNDSVESRLGSLNSHSGVPLPFECFFAAEVDSCSRVEKILHQLFSEYRINPKREFFRIDPEKVVLAISIGPFKDVTPGAVIADQDDKDALAKEKARRPRIKLTALGINPGDVLLFSRDSAVTAQVVADNKVLYNGQVTSLSAAALDALHNMGYKTPAASGSEHWEYDGELLDERRRRMEAEQFDAQPGDEG
jgi:hypothetical protein